MHLGKPSSPRVWRTPSKMGTSVGHWAKSEKGERKPRYFNKDFTLSEMSLNHLPMPSCDSLRLAKSEQNIKHPVLSLSLQGGRRHWVCTAGHQGVTHRTSEQKGRIRGAAQAWGQKWQGDSKCITSRPKTWNKACKGEQRSRRRPLTAASRSGTTKSTSSIFKTRRDEMMPHEKEIKGRLRILGTKAACSQTRRAESARS